MARSVGEAAARGLESGFRLAMDYTGAQDAKKRRDAADAMAAEDRTRTITRQDTNDKLAALGQQEAQLVAEGKGLAAGEPDEATQRDYVQRLDAVRGAKNSLLATVSGYDPTEVKRAAAADIQALNSGNLAAIKPGGLTRAVTAATNRPPTDYLRANGQPAPVELAAADFLEGMDAGDEPRAIKGLNVLFAPQLRKGVGQKGRHGGTIVGKEIIDVVPDPRSSEDDPRVIPTMRIYVDSGKGFNGPRPDGVPKGATGYYDAPLTEGRSSDPNDPVKSIPMKKAMDYIGMHLGLVDTLNKPEAQQLLQADSQSGWDPAQYLGALQSVGAEKPQKLTTKDTVIPAGGSLARTTTDAKGNVVDERIVQGNPKPATGAAARPGTMQQQIAGIDALVEDGTLTEEEGAARKRALASKVTTGTKAQGLAAGTGGGKGGNTGGKGLSAGENRLAQRQLEDTKAEIGDLDKRYDNAQNKLNRVLGVKVPITAPDSEHAEHKAKVAAAQKAFDEEERRINSDRAELKARQKKIRDKLDDGETGGEAAPAAAKPKSGLVLKFDKAGNRVSN